MFVYFNPNPEKKLVGDCVVRGICKLLNADWETAYIHLLVQGYKMHDMPSSNEVWGEFLKEKGFRKDILPDTCPQCYTLLDFCSDHQTGQYLVATGSHVVAVIGGDYYDTWDSGNEIPIYFWRKEE